MSSSRGKRLPLSAAVAAVAMACTPAAASAADVAVFGDGQIEDLLASRGHATTLVTNAQLATPGFLDGFDVFVYTRSEGSLGGTLTAGAADQVKAFVRRTVLLNGDFADTLGHDPEMAELVANSAAWAADGGGGYVGELTGAVAALDANANALRPLGLVAGTAGPINNRAAAGTITATAAGAAHPILQGVELPSDPNDLEFGSVFSGVDPAKVLATYPSGNAAVVVQSPDAPNQAPVVDAIAGPAQADEGSTRTFTVSATDPDGDPLTYAWAVTAGAASVEGDGAGARVAFADGPDTVTLQVTVSDGAGHEVIRTHDVAVANVAPVIGELALAVPEGPACAGGNPVGLAFTVFDPADGVAGTADWGDLAADPFSGSPVGLTHTYAAGTHTVTVSAADDDGAAAQPRTAQVSLLYATSGPFGRLADGDSHRAGRTIPVKVAITDCTGAAVDSLSPQVRLEAADGGVAATGTMRFDGSQYVEKLSTKGLAAGDYELIIEDPAIAPVRTQLTLRA